MLDNPNRTVADISADLLTQSDAERIFDKMAEAGVEYYKRAPCLARLGICLWADDLADMSIAGTERVISFIERRIRAMRRLALTDPNHPHWSYDFNTHVGLWTALKAEQRHLAHMVSSEGLSKVLNLFRQSAEGVPAQRANIVRAAE